jgi:hypothetical protein
MQLLTLTYSSGSYKVVIEYLACIGQSIADMLATIIYIHITQLTKPNRRISRLVFDDYLITTTMYCMLTSQGM